MSTSISDLPQSGSCVFHSATVPQFIQTEQQQFKCNPDNGEQQINAKLSHSKLIIHVLYYQRNAKTGQTQIKRRRFVLGNKDTKDLSDGIAEVNPLILKSVRTRLKRLLVSSPNFDAKEVQEKGGFLNKQLWQANLLWGTGDSLQNNLAQLMGYIKSELRVTDKSLSKKVQKSSGSMGKPRHRFPKKGAKGTHVKVTESGDSRMTNESI